MKFKLLFAPTSGNNAIPICTIIGHTKVYNRHKITTILKESGFYLKLSLQYGIFSELILRRVKEAQNEEGWVLADTLQKIYYSSIPVQIRPKQNDKDFADAHSSYVTVS